MVFNAKANIQLGYLHHKHFLGHYIIDILLQFIYINLWKFHVAFPEIFTKCPFKFISRLIEKFRRVFQIELQVIFYGRRQ